LKTGSAFGERQAVAGRPVCPPLIGDPTLADGILDRLIHNAHRIEMRTMSGRRQFGMMPVTCGRECTFGSLRESEAHKRLSMTSLPRWSKLPQMPSDVEVR